MGTPAVNGYTPEQLIWVNNRNHNAEMEWLEAAMKGELTDKKNMQAQEYKLKRWRAEGLDPLSEEFLDKNRLKQRMHMYKMGDYKMPYEVPSAEECLAKMDLPRSTLPRPPAKGKPPLPTALLFPGQGSQYVGMLKDCMNLPAVKDMLAKAEKVLGWDLKELCLKGPEDKLSQTEYCQPAMFIAGLCAVEVLRESKKQQSLRHNACVPSLAWTGPHLKSCAKRRRRLTNHRTQYARSQMSCSLQASRVLATNRQLTSFASLRQKRALCK